MNSLISFENISLHPVSKEILELNSVSEQYGLTLTEDEARELSETRNTAVSENERVEIGSGPVIDIIKRFCTSRYITKENYTYILNEVTSIFYYIKTETDDKISDKDLLDELFQRFELQCRGSIDVLIGREAERIIRKVNSGENYYKWYADRDELDYDSKTGMREAPANVLDEEYGIEYFEDKDTPADHDKYENEEKYDEEEDIESILDAYDEFLDSEAEKNAFEPKRDVAKENPDDEEGERNE